MDVLPVLVPYTHVWLHTPHPLQFIVYTVLYPIYSGTLRHPSRDPTDIPCRDPPEIPRTLPVEIHLGSDLHTGYILDVEIHQNPIHLA